MVPASPESWLAFIKSFSAQSLVAPYKLIGLQALSVDNAITFLTLVFKHAEIIDWAPFIFVLMHSNGLYSAAGTCFGAAA